MKTFWVIFFAMVLVGQAFSGPPEPPYPPEAPKIPELSKSQQAKLDSLQIKIEIKQREIMKNLPKMDSVLKSINKLALPSSLLAQSESLTLSMLDSISENAKIKDIIIEGGSIQITLNNDSTIVVPGINDTIPGPREDSRINIGSKITVDEGKVVNGNIVNVGADVIVKGSVNGSVMTMGGDIYVASTGFIRDGAVAISGKVKQEAGARIGSVNVALNEAGRFAHSHSAPGNPYRTMARVFLIIYIVWLLLSAIFTSLFKTNISRVTKSIVARPWRSFFMGYLAYLIVFAAIIALCIIIIGIPLAIVGMPLLFLASMILAHTALVTIIGQRFLKSQEISLRTYFYGTVILAGLPGLFFILQLSTGSLVFMIFSWILIGIYALVIIPLGLGAVLATRFGTRPDVGIPDPKISIQVDANTSGPQEEKIGPT